VGIGVIAGEIDNRADNEEKVFYHDVLFDLPSVPIDVRPENGNPDQIIAIA